MQIKSQYQSSETFQKLKLFSFNLCKTFQNHFNKILQFNWCPPLMALTDFLYGLKTISSTVYVSLKPFFMCTYKALIRTKHEISRWVHQFVYTDFW
jgi:hypothetical protein